MFSPRRIWRQPFPAYGRFASIAATTKSVIGARLYRGTPENKTLAAICELYNDSKKTVYAYEKPDGRRYTNDKNGICAMLGAPFDYNVEPLRKIDDSELFSPTGCLPKGSGG